MTDMFSLLAYSWAVVYEHLTGKFDVRTVSESELDDTVVLIMSYASVMIQVALGIFVIDLIV